MNAFPVGVLKFWASLSLTISQQNGTRVFYWDVSGRIKYGTVEFTARMDDGTQIVHVRVDGGGEIVALPVSSVSKVT
ncbi:hypothetical protein PILCRDRAFT_15904 [Piloderma croceum F 1598]|uniref:Uncharacterized protein n=1 Tax=Piloderma croceum (strain F 1598) TaxID=765440 RepID=A0A0C3EXJ2_PILCF|nr:hypothetical protein PILCRDRAFT_15904 [Piloderma croceum F 1598]